MSSSTAGHATSSPPAELTSELCQGSGEQIFTSFTSLPIELRLKIWRSCFVPRRVRLGRNVNDPVIDIRSFGALLLVNREANVVFHEAYPLLFETGCYDGIYFNFALDTLCFGSALISMLRVLVKEYPETMAEIQRIEAQPSDSYVQDFSDELKMMPSLQLITVRWQDGTEWKRWGDSWWIIDSLRNRVNNTVGTLSHSLRILSHNPKPTLAAFFPPREVMAAQLSPLCHPTGPGRLSLLNLKAPSEETIKEAEVDMPQEWRECWPDSGDLAEHGWIACEVEVD